MQARAIVHHRRLTISSPTVSRIRHTFHTIPSILNPNVLRLTSRRLSTKVRTWYVSDTTEVPIHLPSSSPTSAPLSLGPSSSSSSSSSLSSSSSSLVSPSTSRSFAVLELMRALENTLAVQSRITDPSVRSGAGERLPTRIPSSTSLSPSSLPLWIDPFVPPPPPASPTTTKRRETDVGSDTSVRELPSFSSSYTTSTTNHNHHKNTAKTQNGHDKTKSLTQQRQQQQLHDSYQSYQRLVSYLNNTRNVTTTEQPIRIDRLFRASWLYLTTPNHNHHNHHHNHPHTKMEYCPSPPQPSKQEIIHLCHQLLNPSKQKGGLGTDHPDDSMRLFDLLIQTATTGPSSHHRSSSNRYRNDGKTPPPPVPPSIKAMVVAEEVWNEVIHSVGTVLVHYHCTKMTTTTRSHHPHRPTPPPKPKPPPKPPQSQQPHTKNQTTNGPTNNEHERYIENLSSFTHSLTNLVPWPSTSPSSTNYQEYEEEERLETLLRILQCSMEHQDTIQTLVGSNKASVMRGGGNEAMEGRWLEKLDKTKDSLWRLVVMSHRRRLLAVRNRCHQSGDTDCDDTGSTTTTNDDAVATAGGVVEKNTALLMGLLERNNKFWVEERELPYEDVLKMVLERGGVPKPNTALNILQNLYPFQNLRTVESVLSSIINLQQRTTRFKQNGTTNGDGSTETEPNGVYEDYRIDLGTLETISSEASRRANISVVLSLWDYLELIQTSLSSSSSSITTTTANAYEPTEGMYEDAIQTFVRSKGKNDHLALGVLTEMEDRGYVPSRHLVRSLAMGLSSSTGRVQNALYMLQNSAVLMEKNKKKRQRREKYGFEEDICEEEEEEGKTALRASTASINVILSAYARMGNVDEAFRTYDEFENLGCETNGLTYERLMEAVAIDVETATPVIRRVLPKRAENDEDENDEEKEMEIESTHDRYPKYETVVSESPTVGYAVQSPERRGAYEEWMASRLDAAEVVLLVARQRRDRLRRRQRRQQEVAEEGGLDGTIAAVTKDADGEDIELGPELLHQYVRVLCLMGEVDRARDEVCSVFHPDPHVDAVDETDTDVVVDADNGRNEWTDVSLKTLTLLSSSYVRSNDQEGFKVVRNFCDKAGYKNGLPPYAECRMMGS